MPPLLPASDMVINLLADLIQERIGLRYDSSRFDMLVEKLTLLLNEGNFATLLDYYYFLRYDEHAEAEWKRLQSALAVNETYFWREYDQIQAVVEVIVPRLQRERPGKPVRIWHAASATGEEPYTMAIALNEAGCFINGPIEIMATDFNINALAMAREGVFRQRSFRSIPAEIWQRYFVSLDDGKYSLIEPIRNRVQFFYLNILNEKGMKQMKNCDIIICRNAFIYFSGSATRRVVEYFYDALNPDGYLFVAAAESLLRMMDLYELVEVGNAFGYQKRPVQNTNGMKGLHNG